MAEITIDNVSELWDHLGSVWGNLSLEDKAFVEELWKSYNNVVSQLYGELQNVKNNRNVNDIDPLIVENYNFYDIIYATSDDDKYGDLINTFTTASGLVGFSLGEMVLSVSGVINYHYVDENNPWVPEELEENVDYVISGYNSIIFLNNPPFALSEDYPVLQRSVIYIESIYKVNPALFRLWGKQLEFNSDIYVNDSYNCWSQYTSGLNFDSDKIEHYRQIIRALRFWSFQPPTVKSVENSVGISYGLPFAYESGLVSHELVTDKSSMTLGTNL